MKPSLTGRRPWHEWIDSTVVDGPDQRSAVCFVPLTIQFAKPLDFTNMVSKPSFDMHGSGHKDFMPPSNTITMPQDRCSWGLQQNECIFQWDHFCCWKENSSPTNNASQKLKETYHVFAWCGIVRIILPPQVSSLWDHLNKRIVQKDKPAIERRFRLIGVYNATIVGWATSSWWEILLGSSSSFSPFLLIYPRTYCKGKKRDLP